MKSLEPRTPVYRLTIGFVLVNSFTLSFALFIDTLRLQARSGRVVDDWEVLGTTRHLITSICGVKVTNCGMAPDGTSGCAYPQWLYQRDRFRSQRHPFAARAGGP